MKLALQTGSRLAVENDKGWGRYLLITGFHCMRTLCSPNSFVITVESLFVMHVWAAAQVHSDVPICMWWGSSSWLTHVCIMYHVCVWWWLMIQTLTSAVLVTVISSVSTYKAATIVTVTMGSLWTTTNKTVQVQRFTTPCCYCSIRPRLIISYTVLCY